MIASELQKLSEFVAGAFIFGGFTRGGERAKTAASPLPDTRHFHLRERLFREVILTKKKSYFSVKISRNLRNGRELAVFLSKTHSLCLKKVKQMCKAQKIVS